MIVDALNFEFLLIVNTWQSLLVLKLQQSLALSCTNFKGNLQILQISSCKIIQFLKEGNKIRVMSNSKVALGVENTEEEAEVTLLAE